MSRASLKALSAFGASPNLRKRPMSHLVVCWLSSLNGLELSRPAARATVHPFSRILAGNGRSNLPLASRVRCSELLARSVVHCHHIGDTLSSRHRWHSAGQVDLATGHGHPRHDILDAVLLQVVPTDLVE